MMRDPQTHPNMLVEVDNPVLYSGLKLLLIDTESGLNLVKSVEEVFTADLHLVDVIRKGGEGSDLC
jgi:hypothetical protein